MNGKVITGLDHEYMIWLMQYVDIAHPELESAHLSYDILVAQLLQHRFRYHIPLDENRELDGLELRNMYALERNTRFTSWMLTQPCTVMEVLAALAGRMDSVSGEEADATGRFFAEMIRNLGLDVFTDDHCTSFPDESQEQIADIVDNWLDRRFDDCGNGSPFPLKELPEGMGSMRFIQIWDAMQAYILDKYVER